MCGVYYDIKFILGKAIGFPLNFVCPIWHNKKVLAIILRLGDPGSFQWSVMCSPCVFRFTLSKSSSFLTQSKDMQLMLCKDWPGLCFVYNQEKLYILCSE